MIILILKQSLLAIGTPSTPQANPHYGSYYNQHPQQPHPIFGDGSSGSASAFATPGFAYTSSVSAIAAQAASNAAAATSLPKPKGQRPSQSPSLSTSVLGESQTVCSCPIQYLTEPFFCLPRFASKFNRSAAEESQQKWRGC